MSSPALIPTHVPVLLIGGGIVGLSASLFLAHHSIPSLLIERHSSTSIHPRARGVNARTMEIYRGIGLSDAVRDAGASLSPSFGIYSSSTSLRDIIETHPRLEAKRELPFAGRAANIGPEKGTFVAQDMSEPVLLAAVRKRGDGARFYTECLGVEQDGQMVTARLKDRESGDEFTVTADYLIAADGANSPIRSQLGVSTTGCGAIGHLLNILFHADLKSLVDKREFSICVIDRPGVVVGAFTSINNSDRWVFHLHYDPSAGEKPADYPPSRCVELLRVALGMPGIEIDIKSILPWEPSVRVATALQHGRVFLAGDAAHQMPPYTGQGANSGIADAHNLAWKLAAVIKGGASAKLLETYDVERLPVGRAAAEASAAWADDRGLISVTSKLGFAARLAKVGRMVSGFGYNYSSAAVVEESTWPLGGATWKAWSLSSIFLGLDGRPGSRAPHVWVEKRGMKISTIDLFGKGFVVLAGGKGGAWIEASREVKKKLDGVELSCYCLGPNIEGDEVVDKERRWEVAAGISSTGALLVRPDGFVAWRERRTPVDVERKLDETMRKILCL